MFCSNCGTKLNENFKFCTNCGAKVDDMILPDCDLNADQGADANKNITLSEDVVESGQNPQKDETDFAQAQSQPVNVATEEKPSYIQSAPTGQANLEQYIPADVFAPNQSKNKIAFKKTLWHIIGVFACLSLMILTAVSLIKPADGILTYAARESLAPEGIMQNIFFLPLALVLMGVSLFVEMGMTEGLMLAIAMVLGYLVMLSATVNLAIYIIASMFGKNKTGVASYATLATAIAALVMVIAINGFNGKFEDTARKEMGVSYYNAEEIEDFIDDYEDEYDVDIPDVFIAPSVQLCYLVALSSGTFAVIRISKHYKRKA